MRTVSYFLSHTPPMRSLLLERHCWITCVLLSSAQHRSERWVVAQTADRATKSAGRPQACRMHAQRVVYSSQYMPAVFSYERHKNANTLRFCTKSSLQRKKNPNVTSTEGKSWAVASTNPLFDSRQQVNHALWPQSNQPRLAFIYPGLLTVSTQTPTTVQ